MYVKVGKKLQNQKENVEILDHFLANLKTHKIILAEET